MRKIIAALTAAAFLLAGCTTTDPYTGEQKTSNATQGAVIGGLLGAGIGALTNTSSGKQAARNALIGAGIGALAGGAVGGYMDQQEAELRQRLQSAGVSVRRVGNNIQLVMASDITFDTGLSQVKPEFYQTLSAVAEVLREYNKTYVEVSGHTDNVGATAFNERLSQDRAVSVADVLSRNGVNGYRLIPAGFGERRPVADNKTKDGRSKNRRVEIQIIPHTS
jgi:outer membrane protein OmpA-like peptidoglycan-associated protein